MYAQTLGTTQKTPRNNRGFSIVEVMVTAVVIGVGLLALSSLHLVATKGNASGERLTIATQLAYSKVAELKSLMYYQDITHKKVGDVDYFKMDPRLAPGNYPADQSQIAVGPSGSCQDGEICMYNLTWVIDDLGLDQQALDAHKEVRVTVTWPDPSMPEGSISMSFPPSIIAVKFR